MHIRRIFNENQITNSSLKIAVCERFRLEVDKLKNIS